MSASTPPDPPTPADPNPEAPREWVEDRTDAFVSEIRAFLCSQSLPEVAEAIETRLADFGWRMIRRGDPKSSFQYELRRPDGSIVMLFLVTMTTEEREILQSMGRSLAPVLMTLGPFAAGVNARIAHDLSGLAVHSSSHPRKQRRFEPVHAQAMSPANGARMWADLNADEQAFVRAEWPELDDERLQSLGWIFITPSGEVVS